MTAIEIEHVPTHRWRAFAVLAVAFLTLLLVQLASWVPGVTPRKVLYHPRWPWHLFDRKKS